MITTSLLDNEGRILNLPRRLQLWRHTEHDTATQGNMRTCTVPHGPLKKDRLCHHTQGTMNCRCASNSRNMGCGPTNCGDSHPHKQHILLWTANFLCRRRPMQWTHSPPNLGLRRGGITTETRNTRTKDLLAPVHVSTMRHLSRHGLRRWCWCCCCCCCLRHGERCAYDHSILHMHATTC